MWGNSKVRNCATKRKVRRADDIFKNLLTITQSRNLVEQAIIHRGCTST